MDPERWRRVTGLFHAAVEQPPARREVFLADACADDPSLRAEVDALLAGDGHSGEPLASPAAPIRPGTMLGAYRIESLLGAGGMGDVYRAKDTTLGRDVALKLLPASFTHDPDRLARFRREAHVLASLNHPHIGAIYGLDEADGQPFLALELVDGDTLADRIARGPLPIESALDVARQIADALEAAHDKGVVHRDLKPANIKVRIDGTVKVLDFGLAKIDSGSVPDLTHSPTVFRPTADGTLLGTAPYMSPEQARGNVVDKRTDVWAFGCVLFEMLTGIAAFPGASVSDTLAAILTRDPDWTKLPSATPASVRRVLERCLRKNPRQRLRDIADVRLDLEETSTIPGISASAVGVRDSVPHAAMVAAAVLVVVAVAALAFWRARGSESRVSAPTTRTTLSLPAGTQLDHDGGIAISPDGQTLAFVASSSDGARLLHIRRLGEWESRSIPGTERALSPFFSPDGQSVAFGQEVGVGLKRVPVVGGPALLICPSTGYFQGGTWGRDGQIIFATWGGDTALWRVRADGGTPDALKRPTSGGSTFFLRPERLPADRAVLFTLLRQGQSSIVALVPGESELRTIIKSGAHPRYLPTGHLLYVFDGYLLSVPFDLQRLEARGAVTVVLDDVTEDQTKADYDVSAGGTLVYLPSRSSLATLVWKDRRGLTTPLGLNPRRYSGPKLSPDGRQLSVTIGEGPARNVWMGSVEREPLTRLTFSNDDYRGLWTHDGRRLFFGSGQDGRYNLYWMPTDGSGRVERLTDSPHAQLPTSVSPRDDVLLFNEQGVHQLSLGSKESQPVLPAGNVNAVFSPNGRWIAYSSMESGRLEVYVQAYPGPGLKIQISVGGGALPHWNPNGSELFFKSGTAMVAVPVLDTQTFRAGAPVKLFTYTEYDYDVSSAGQRFLMVENADAGSVAVQFNLIQHWFEELNARVPTK